MISRKTALKPGERKGWDSTIKPRSKRTESVYRKRRPLVARLLRERPMCERCGAERSVDVHERLRRSAGGAIVEGEKATRQGQVFFCLCRDCHDWVTNHGREAIAEGWSVSRHGTH